MPNKEWNSQNAVPAFTAALSRSGHDREYRDRLTASLESARQAVSEEGEIDIPEDIVILFHENKLNEKYHVFYLPPFDPNQKDVRHESVAHFQGLYNTMRPAATARTREWRPENAFPAFTDALSRSGHDSQFRDRLKASLESAREAVSEEGNIDIPDDNVIVFHEDQLNEKYHAFYLPPFDPDRTDVAHEYETHFQGFYNAWVPH
jgi:hypothetical protein